MTVVTRVAAQVRPLIPSNVTKGLLGQAAALGQVVVKNSSEEWVLADADSAALAVGLLGIIVAGGAENSAGTLADGEMAAVLLWGRVTGFTGLNGGANYYLSGTAGAIDTAAGTVSRFLGHAEDTNIFVFNPVGVATS